MIRPPIPRLFILTSALATASTAVAATTPAGTLIENLATANFDPVTPGGETQASSNRVVTIVQGICAVSIVPKGQPDAFIMGGEQAQFGFTVTNAGNKDYFFPITVSSSGLRPPPELTLYLDSNNNNLVDTDEKPVSYLNLPSGKSANVVALVNVPQDTRGEGLIKLVTSCGGGNEPVSATARITVAPPPFFEVKKSFSPALVRPGSETTVTVTTTNMSFYPSREVELTDMLEAELEQGLVFVPGSAQTNVGVLEYTDGATWSSSIPAVVKGIRVRVNALAPDATIKLTFTMRAEEKADGKKITNVAIATTGGRDTKATAIADVRYQPGVAIGPAGNPQAPEGSPADSQTQAFAVVGREVCFSHTLLNTGDVKDNFRITITYPVGTATGVVRDNSGAPLVQPILLNPGESTLVRVCHTPTEAKPLEALITVTGDRGTTNSTIDRISEIEAGLPELKKTYAATSTGDTGQTVPLAAGATVRVGDTITYNLSVHNPYNRPLKNVQLSDPLPGHVNFVSASEGGQVAGAAGEQVVSWTLGTLQAGETRNLTIVAQVSDRSVDGENLTNVFKVTSTEFSDPPLESNPVNTPVWNAQLIIIKEVSAKTVTYGDKVTYTLRIRNASTTTPLESAVVTDVPAKGLQYIPGTTQLNGKALSDPTNDSGTLKWNAGSIPANGEIVITYDMRVTPEANGDLQNTASVMGIGAGGAAKAIASNRAQITAKLDPLKFAPVADLIGVVFVDRNRNGLFEKGLDTPVERARVILAGGRLALTDTAGRYHFSNVPMGTWALRLDPNTTPYPPLQKPQEGGLAGTQTAHVRGLTSVDFPLAPLGGDITAIRRTTLTMGDVKVEKAVYAVKDGYVVTLKITTPATLTDFRLEDPLPGGATLKEGSNSLSTTLSAGETNLTYHFDWTGEPNAATTDPVVSWRY